MILGSFQGWHYTVRRNGISFLRGIENIQTARGRTGRLEPGTGKQPGADKPIGRPGPLGIKKALVFYAGKAPKGIKTNWIMHEYRLANVDRSAGKKNNLRLDDWVLCRIYNKKGSVEKHFPSERKSTASYPEMEDRKPDINEISGYQNGMSQVAAAAMVMSDASEFLQMDTSDSIPEVEYRLE
ncbi:putative proteinC DOMAIN-CONTAINING PROTEIN-RELATED [Salix purpurea]|uniref:NAC domain-containing protein n=1 Tax=Salix purpurea TaxID=77065 RepID=A0A9Q0V4F4_SALPP|nr:putative proteinC DOMAIN-CONTAINING PROTEIN-RELATED [Salix purpurea]